jgi:hypothetical protein
MKTRLEGLPTLWDDYKRVQDELEFLDYSEEHFKDRESFETTFYDVKAIMSTLTEEANYVPHSRASSEHKMLVNAIRSNLMALQTISTKIPVHEILLSDLVLGRADYKLRQDWEVYSASVKFPSLEQVLQFIETRCQALELSDINISEGEGQSRGNDARMSNRTKMRLQVVNVSAASRCILCNAGHYLCKCPKFLNSSIESKLHLVKEKKLCFNCLHSGHGSKECRSSLCRICKGKHHTSIH